MRALLLLLILPLAPVLRADGFSFRIYVRVTEKTAAPLLRFAGQGDLFWGRDLARIPAANRALTVSSFKHLERRLKEWPADQIAAVNFDAEHRDYDAAVRDTRKIRAFVDRVNRTTKRPQPLRFIAFMHMRIIDQKPDIIRHPDIVMVGKSYWNADNITGDDQVRRRRSAPQYVAAIRKAERTPAILLGDTEKDPHDSAALIRTMTKILLPEKQGGLNISHIGFFYPGDQGESVIAAIKHFRDQPF